MALRIVSFLVLFTVPVGGLLDSECVSPATQCRIVRPHFLYDDETAITVEGDLYLNAALHCVQHLCAIALMGRRVTIDSSAEITGARISIVAEEVNIQGVINTDGRGYSSSQGQGQGNVPVSLYSGAVGGGYNGVDHVRCHGSSYGSAVQFGRGQYGDEEESLQSFEHHVGNAGGQGVDATVLGGRGGGMVTVNASASLVVDGRITANGQPGVPGINGSCSGGGGGSGGSIVLSAPIVSGSGTVLAMGAKGGMTYVDAAGGCGGGATFGTPGGSGEGGRIALFTPTVGHAIDMSVKGGVQNEWQCVDGGDGQIFYAATRYFNPPPGDRRD